ncbi:hypothetical protein PHMEG_0001194 [Phytophthora megakarya]|uniref:WW domain-containing protein n=1 Tax=Phytophthora megakarya TaxID=4795 RepID=A0A225X3S2_9STRA|nr:hypothetical protein PHMEG_0001194 [Phytophthora megakarya]
MASIFDANPKETDGSLDAVAQTPCYKEPNSFDDEDIPLQERSQPASITSDNVIPRSDAKEIVDESPTLSADHHNMANKIQAQYRCFVRRRIILDQLRFILAKQRRKARKSRLKVKKAKTVDKDASDETAVVHVAADANSMDNLPEGVQQVAPTSMRSEIGGEITSAALVVEPSEPTMARKDSCDYAFDLFDDAEDVNGEVMQEAAAVEDKLPMEVVIHTDVDKPSSEKLYDQLLLSKRDVMVTSTSATTTKDVIITSISATATIESLQVEEDVFSTLTFLDVEEKPAKPVDAVFVEALKGTPRAQPHWERYVDSTTSDSFYYNPSTNETQWTAPQKDRANAAINSSRVTPTTPQSATATADAVVSPNGQPLSSQEATGTWQEFLDEATGHLYYYNTKTGECSWEPPASSGDTPGVVESLQSVATAERASPWIMYFDPVSQAPYYVNTETMATSWEQPEEFTTAPSDADMYVFAVEDHSALEI